MKCECCGASYPADAKRCVYCGNYFESASPPPPPPPPVQPVPPPPVQKEIQYIYIEKEPVAHQSKWVAFFLCLFCGMLGFHRFYVGKIFTGLLYLCTWGGFGFGVLIDFVRILAGNFTNKQGRPLRK